MQRRIIGFEQDDAGDWVALLECGHRQHVRHKPPFINRPWTQSPDGRAAHLGVPLECPSCDRDVSDVR
jgi:tellurite methyltransferase